MAKNLQVKLPSSDTIRLFDINKDAAEKLASEMRLSQAGGAAVELVESVVAAANDVVRPSVSFKSLLLAYMMSLFYL